VNFVLYIHYILLYDYIVYFIHKLQSVGGLVSHFITKFAHILFILILKIITISLSYMYLLVC